MRQLKSFLSIMVVTFVVYTAPAFAAEGKDVNVVNTPNVNVVTMPNVVVDAPMRIPFQKTLNTTDWGTQSVNLILDAPLGQRLVIEHISAFASMGPNEELSSFAVSTVVNMVSATHIFSLSETAPGFTGSNTYAGGQIVRIYADEGALITFTKVPVGGGSSFGSASVTVSGYLIPMTSPTLGP